MQTTYSYNSATGELLSAVYSDQTPSITRSYDRLGNLATVNDATGLRTFTRNSHQDLTTETISGIYNKTLSYSYENSGIKGRYLGLRLDNVENHRYTYDALGRISKIHVNNEEFTYTRLANSELLDNMTRPNGVGTTWSYESKRNLITQVMHNTASCYGYVNDSMRRRTSMSRSGNVFAQSDTLNYTYNDRSEVTGALSDIDTAYSYNYSFDPIGNRLTATLSGLSMEYTTNALNQYTAINTETPSYDADGNMQTRDGWTQEWNGENRLVKLTKGERRLEFIYDYMWRRVEKKIYDGNSLTKHLRFVYHNYKLIEELNALNNNNPLRRYTWQPKSVGLDVPLRLADVIANSVYYYHTDANKNITELTDATGNVVAHYEYSPFGIQTKASGSWATDNPFRFSSEYFDSETGLVYYNYRYYSPNLGRWLSRDPIEEEGGWNLYGMAGNDMLNYLDEIGLKKSLLDSFREAIGCAKKAKDTKDTVDSAKDSIKNAKTIADTNSSPGDKARASTEEISKEADRAGRKTDAKNANEAGKKTGKTLDEVQKKENNRNRLMRELLNSY